MDGSDEGAQIMSTPGTSDSVSRIVLIGATGFTGELVARHLLGLDLPAGPTAPDAGLPALVLAARDPVKLDALRERLVAPPALPRTAVLDVRDRGSLRSLIRAGDVVINTAGPFEALGEPVVAACVEAGASYVDTTGEQPWMRAMAERYHGAAEAAGVAVVNGMAFEWALGDCAAALLAARLGGLRALDVIYAWGGAASSRGTRRTSLRIARTRAWELEGGAWRRVTLAARRRRVALASGGSRWAVSFGAGEVVTVPRWAAAETVRGWLVTGPGAGRLLRLSSRALPLIGRVLGPVLEPLATRSPDPTPRSRHASVFTIRLEGEAPDGTRGAVEVRGSDPYGLTAAVAVAGVRAALRPGRASGVLAPSQLVDPASLLDGLAPRGVVVAPER